MPQVGIHNDNLIVSNTLEFPDPPEIRDHLSQEGLRSESIDSLSKRPHFLFGVPEYNSTLTHEIIDYLIHVCDSASVLLQRSRPQVEYPPDSAHRGSRGSGRTRRKKSALPSVK